MEVSLDEVVFPQEYVRGQLAKVKRDYRLSTAQMAKLAGFERTAWARIMKSGVPNTQAIYRLSVHFGLPVSFWFPPIHALAVPIQVTPPKSCRCHDAAPLSIAILEAVKPLPAIQKQSVLKLAKAVAEREIPSLAK